MCTVARRRLTQASAWKGHEPRRSQLDKQRERRVHSGCPLEKTVTLASVLKRDTQRHGTKWDKRHPPQSQPQNRKMDPEFCIYLLVGARSGVLRDTRHPFAYNFTPTGKYPKQSKAPAEGSVSSSQTSKAQTLSQRQRHNLAIGERHFVKPPKVFIYSCSCPTFTSNWAAFLRRKKKAPTTGECSTPKFCTQTVQLCWLDHGALL